MDLNPEIKRKARAEKIPYWEIAKEIGVCEMTVSRWMRLQLPPEKEKLINSAIDAIIEKRGVTA